MRPKVLKFEEMGLWYAGVVSALGLQHEVGAGWGDGSFDLRSGRDLCFFQPCGRPCETAATPLTDAELGQCAPSSLMPTTVAATQLAEHYTDASVVERAREFMRPDFALGGYPESAPVAPSSPDVGRQQILLLAQPRRLGGHVII